MTRIEILTGKLLRKEISENERAELASFYVPAARAIARKFKNQDDYFGPALFGIAYAFDNPREDMREWIASCITRMVKDHYCRDVLIPIPRATAFRHKKKGIEMKRIKVQAICPTMSKQRTSKTYDKIMDALEEVSQDPIDKAIIQLRIDGYQDCEIGAKLKISRQTVNNRRANLETRFTSYMAAA